VTHPNSLDLEAFACGEELSVVATHLGSCDACRRFVDGIRGIAAPTELEVRRLVAAAEARPAPRAAAAPDRRRALWTVTSIAFPFAAAAAVFLLVRGPTPKEGRAPGVTGSASGAAPTHQEEPSSELAPAWEPGTSFKGARQVAVIRERGGEQTRFTDRVVVREGDRLRIEVALDRDQAILAGVVGDDGSWLELMPSGVRSPGTHYSEKSARVSGPKTNATIVVGGRTLDDAPTKIRVEWESSP
jgi:hypothetical protein